MSQSEFLVILPFAGQTPPADVLIDIKMKMRKLKIRSASVRKDRSYNIENRKIDFGK